MSLLKMVRRVCVPFAGFLVKLFFVRVSMVTYT
jgi:hypothetical protein